ncbi:acetyl esterase/lipase [Neobacillus bataviensis]|uniref:Acetyl esterase/lipase n=1 Tax=Neobacillus bataviensis TaxID=220685 RepID=A0A561CAU0_9BACI|nr:alpha/beta hydrolase [Neobacillus bataviensis]TWD88286.1 acetyl esterase/lipase [Neobacillus bataviensis]
MSERYEVRVLTDLEFASPNGKSLLLDLYLPIGAEGPVPVIVWLHGGGWRIGDRKLGPDLKVRFAERGYAMASIEYRLSSEAIFPAQIYDVKAAIRWLRSVANEYGLDSKHIGLWGSSAGGHLAALAGTTGSGRLEDLELGNWESLSDVQAVVDGYGPTDFLQMEEYSNSTAASSDDLESVRFNSVQRHTDPDSPESQLLGAPIQTVPHLVREANPITYIDENVPPFLILHGLSDTAVPVHQSELLYRALIENGNEAALCLIEGLGHAFFNKNDLDELPLQVTLRKAEAGEPEQIESSKKRIFELVESFFRKHLFEN